MKNLKRALSLALASIMVFGMMVVGAGAVEFNDADKIENVDAVNTMVALGVLKGKDTGDFDPAGIVTRAEMAKIICVMLSGGTEPNLGTSAAAYPDTANHWANSYIAYCSNLNIVAGDNHGNFNPDTTVTGTEAAKMLLVALGYDSDVFMFTGAKWAINVNTLATQIKLYDDVSASADAGLSRDNAAQMALNALDALLMEKTYDKVLSNGEISYQYGLGGTSFLRKYFDALTFVGTYVGNYDTSSSANKGEITINGRLNTAKATDPYYNASFPSTLDIANIGEQVKVIFKDGRGGYEGRPDKHDNIFGAFNTGVTQVEKVTKGDMQDSESTSKLKFGGTKYDIASSVRVVTNYMTDDSDTTTSGNAATIQGLLKAQSVDDIKFIFNDEGRITRAYVTNYFAGRVTGLTSAKITISGVGSIELEDNIVAEDIKKDDVVVYTRFYETNANKEDALYTVNKAESIEGEFTGYKYDSKSSTYQNVVVDGTTYKVETPKATIADLTDDAITNPASTNIGDTVRVYLAKGMAVALQTIEGGAGQYALITECSDGSSEVGSTMNALKVTVLLPDGTKETVSVHKDSTKDGSDKFSTDRESGDQQALVQPGTLVKYTSLANGTIKIKSVAGMSDDSNANGAISTTPKNVWDKDAKTLVYTGTTSAVAAVDAPAFVMASGKYYAYNLRGLGDISNSDSGIVVGSYLDEGLVVAAYMELDKKPGSSTADTLYGIVTGYVGTRIIDEDTYYRYSIAVGRDEDVIVNVGSNDILSAGNLVKFDETSDGKYDDTAELFTILVSDNDTTDSSAALGAVKTYNESNRLLTYYTDLNRASIDGAFTGSISSVTVDKDVKIVYVNAKDNEAGEEMGVNAFDAATGYANVVLHMNDEGIVDGIIVETSGKANLASVASDKDVATVMFGATEGVTLTGVDDIAAVDGANASYTVTTNKVSPAVGETFTIKVELGAGGIDKANSKEIVDVIYNGTTKSLTFTEAGTKTASFTAASGEEAVTLEVNGTPKAEPEV